MSLLSRVVPRFAVWGDEAAPDAVTVLGRALAPLRHPAALSFLAALLVWRISGATQFLAAALEANSGASVPDIAPEALLGLPVAWILAARASTGRLVLPGLGPFLFFECVALLRELVVWLGGGIFDWGYGYGLFLIYAAFAAFLNLGLTDRAWRILWRSLVAAAAVMVAGVFLAWLTPIQLTVDVVTADDASITTGRLMAAAAIHPNGLAFALATAVAVLLAHRKETRRAPRLFDIAFILAALVVVTLYASRGGVLMILGLVGHHVFWRRGSVSELALKAGLAVLAVVGLGTVFVLTQSSPEQRLFVVQRFTTEVLSRPQQVQATWASFLQAPIFGHGEAGVGSTGLHHVVRSNFHPTQVLAAYGLLGFVPWALLMGRLVFSVRRLDRWLLGLIALAAYNFNLIMPIAILAFWNLRDRRRAKEGIRLHSTRRVGRPAAPEPV